MFLWQDALLIGIILGLIAGSVGEALLICWLDGKFFQVKGSQCLSRSKKALSSKR
jgi:hypothetical protein